MNTYEVADLFALIVRIDTRRKAVGESPADIVAAWTPLLNHISAPMAVAAVHAHYATSSEPILPVHIIRYANSQRPAYDYSDEGCSLGSRCKCTHTDPCDGGWIEVRPAGPESHATVRRCPNCCAGSAA